jgi:guanine deaminase
MTNAIQVSKLRQVHIAPEEKAVSLEEAFYLGSAGGGAFFGKNRQSGSGTAEAQSTFGPAGSFEPGYDFDAIVIDDSSLCASPGGELRDRLERVIYLSDDRQITGKYVRGAALF